MLQKEIFDKYKNSDDFVLLILGREHNWDEINKFKTEQGFTMPFYPDPERNVFSVYAEQNIPRNFIIDKDGKIATSSIGFEVEEFQQVVKKVESLLNWTGNQKYRKLSKTIDSFFCLVFVVLIII